MMKKNRMMRLASGLLVAVLMTTSMISGTFAKYVTTASGADNARVAKFGVTVEASTGTAFKTEYTKHDDENTEYTGVTVKAVDEKKVVAPGTSSSDVDGDFKFIIKGTPEVAVKVELSTNAENMKDVFLKAGTYTDWTSSPYKDDKTPSEETFELSDDYYPVKWTLAVKDHNEEGDYEGKLIENATLKEVEAAVNNYVTSYKPNTKLDAEFILTWAWAFDGEQTLSKGTAIAEGDTIETVEFDATTVDQADTLLGNIAAGTETTVDSNNYSTDVAFDFTITVTQID